MFVGEVIGNLGSDAIVKDFNGKKYVCMNIAHSSTKKNQDGTKTETTVWISALQYGDGGNLLQYLKKGTKVFVRGRVHVKTFQRQDGSFDSGINIDVTELNLCGSKNDQPAAAQPATAQPASQPAAVKKDPEEDLPF